MALVHPDNPRTTGPSDPLRVGLLVDSMTQPAWVERALRRMIEAGDSRFVIVVRNAAPAPDAPSSRAGSWWRNRRHILFAAYTRFDRRNLPIDNNPFAPVDVSAMLGGAPVIDVVPRQTRMTDTIEDCDLGRIRAAEPDVLIRLGFRILRGGILTAAPHGVWSYHHGDNARYRGGPPCFWEVIEDAPVTGIILQRLTETLDGGDVLYRSWGATNRYSVERNRVEAYWKGAEFLARALRRLRMDGALAPDDAPLTYGHRLYVAPRNAEMAKGIAGFASRRAAEKWRTLTEFQQWFLAYRYRTGIDATNVEPDLTPFRFTPILPPKDRFWADPFPVRIGSADFILFEDYPYASRRGVISVLELGPRGPVGGAQVVLSRDYHLSYPFAFTWRGEHWLLPESADVGRVELYRARRPPFDWDLESVLIDELPLADCTLAEIDGRWWMFATSAAMGASFWDELHLFHASSPLGPWTPHLRNPVVSDVRSARPAGALFRRGGRWYRPSQDCSRGYGSAMNLQRIVRLTESAYEEETVGRILPDWAPRLTGTHTINALGGLTVIDARRKVRWMSLRG